MRILTNARFVIFFLIISMIFSACAPATPTETVEPYLVAENGNQFFQLKTEEGGNKRFSVIVEGGCAVVEVSVPVELQMEVLVPPGGNNKTLVLFN